MVSYSSYKYKSYCLQKLRGNRLLQLAGDSLVDVNCTTLLGENDILLVGAEEGLYACQLSYTSEPLIHIEGVSNVYQMSSVSIPDKLILITGLYNILYGKPKC